MEKGGGGRKGACKLLCKNKMDARNRCVRATSNTNQHEILKSSRKRPSHARRTQSLTFFQVYIVDTHIHIYSASKYSSALRYIRPVQHCNCFGINDHSHIKVRRKELKASTVRVSFSSHSLS